MYVPIQVTRTQMWERSVDSSLFFISDNLYGRWFVFFTKYEFQNIDMEGTGCIELRHVFGVQ